jgi:hypothetical protein
VGIGLDEWDEFGASCASPFYCTEPQSVVVRGAQSKSYPLLTPPVFLSAFPALGQVASVSRPSLSVRITLSPATPEPTLTVEIDPTGTGAAFVKVINALPLTVADNGPAPTNLNLGFSAATGSSQFSNYHEVRIKSAKTFVSSVPALGQNTLGALAVLLALLTLPALCCRLNG